MKVVLVVLQVAAPVLVVKLYHPVFKVCVYRQQNGQALDHKYMTQMKEWYSLLDCGAITNEEYEVQKRKILEDLNIL